MLNTSVLFHNVHKAAHKIDSYNWLNGMTKNIFAVLDEQVFHKLNV